LFKQYYALQKHKKNQRDLDFSPMTLIFNGLLNVVKVHVMQNVIKLSAAIIVLTEKTTKLETILPSLS